MNTNKLSENYLFRNHDKKTVVRWINALNFGYYKRAWGGHANDGDEFGIWLNYSNRSELYFIMDIFGIELLQIPEGYPKHIIGKSYSSQEFQKFKSEVKDFPEFEQPGRTHIHSIPCFIWIENGEISIKFSGASYGGLYEVSEIDFNNCLKVEAVIKDNDLAKYVNSEFDKYVTHISRKKYSELFY